MPITCFIWFQKNTLFSHFATPVSEYNFHAQAVKSAHALKPETLYFCITISLCQYQWSKLNRHKHLFLNYLLQILLSASKSFREIVKTKTLYIFITTFALHLNNSGHLFSAWVITCQWYSRSWFVNVPTFLALARRSPRYKQRSIFARTSGSAGTPLCVLLCNWYNRSHFGLISSKQNVKNDKKMYN